MDLCTDISRECCDCRECCPPACPEIVRFPVAMAYVPWQQWQPTYVPEQGLAQGTIFPDLDLPFHCRRCGR